MAADEHAVTRVTTVEAIGALVRARRRASGLTQAQAAGLSGVGTRFFSELERGKPTLECGRVLQVLARFGFDVAIAPRGAHAFESARRPPVGAVDAASARETEQAPSRPADTASAVGARARGGEPGRRIATRTRRGRRG